MYILIMVAWLGGFVYGPIFTAQEFTSQQNCASASDALEVRLKEWRDKENKENKFLLMCVAK